MNFFLGVLLGIALVKSGADVHLWKWLSETFKKIQIK